MWLGTNAWPGQPGWGLSRFCPLVVLPTMHSQVHPTKIQKGRPQLSAATTFPCPAQHWATVAATFRHQQPQQATRMKNVPSPQMELPTCGLVWPVDRTGTSTELSSSSSSSSRPAASPTWLPGKIQATVRAEPRRGHVLRSRRSGYLVRAPRVTDFNGVP